jgi:prefoldin subunit 5|tara:strand:+ start:3660 stop:3881 length:222 start_codon:yes stop_codon:yes gene_type:complete
MDQLKEQVTKIEWRVDQHDEEIKLLHSASDELRTTLNSITKNLQQIKWIAIGGGLVVLSDQIGLTTLFKLAAI